MQAVFGDQFAAAGLDNLSGASLEEREVLNKQEAKELALYIFYNVKPSHKR